MRKTDISDYTEISEKPSAKHNSVAGSVIKNTFLLIWRTLLTLITILFIACVIIGISMVMYVASIAREPTGIDLHSAKLNETSYIYIYDKNANPQQYMQLYTSENRVTVDFDDIPDYMKKAIVAIEDKRFYEHHGVDWYRTAGAIFSLSTGGSQFGGSTLTQQLIKNITNDKDVSISRKLKEIFRALNVEREFTKDEILEVLKLIDSNAAFVTTLPDYLMYLAILGGLIAFIFLKNSLIRLLGNVFEDRSVTMLYISSNNLFYFVGGFVFVPLMLLLFYCPAATETILKTTIFLVGIIFIVRLFRGIQLILTNSKTSKLYLFYYLCIFEIVPILVMAKIVLL